MILEHSMNGAWPRTTNSDSKQSCSYVPLTLYKKAEDPRLSKYHWKWLKSFGICYKTEDIKFWGIVALQCYQGLDEKNNEGFFVLFCLGKAHFKSSLLIIVVLIIPELYLLCLSYQPVICGFSHPVSATSCYTNSWSVSRLWPSFPYSFHIPAISSVAWKSFHFASVSLVPPYQSRTLITDEKKLISNLRQIMSPYSLSTNLCELLQR